MSILQVAEFKYPNCHVEVIAEDARQLLTAMKKAYPNVHFSTVTRGKGPGMVLHLEVTGSNDFQRLSMTYFAQGFMASSHLWER